MPKTLQLEYADMGELASPARRGEWEGFNANGWGAVIFRVFC